MTNVLNLDYDKEEKQVSSRFAVSIRNARKKKGYSLQRLAEMIQTSPSYLHRLETYERRNPSISVFLALSEALQLDIFELFQTAIDAEERAVKSLPSLLLQNDFLLDDKVVTVDARICLSDIVSFVLEEMKESFDFKKAHELIGMIERLNEIRTQEREEG